MWDAPKRNSTVNAGAADETISMIDHPLVTQSQEKDLTAVSRFACAAREITGVKLAECYRQVLAAELKREEHYKLYFVGCVFRLKATADSSQRLNGVEFYQQTFLELN